MNRPKSYRLDLLKLIVDACGIWQAFLLIGALEKNEPWWALLALICLLLQARMATKK